MTDKAKSQTFQQITRQEDINDVLKKPNITLKERHDGLTVKFSNNNIINYNIKSLKTVGTILTDNDESISEISEDEEYYDAIDDLNTIYTEELTHNQTITKQIASLNDNTSEEKSADNFSKYSYNALTIFEDKNISEFRKVLLKLERELDNIKEKNKDLSKLIKKNNYDWKDKFKELWKSKTKLIEIELNIKNNTNFDNNLLSKKYFLINNIENIEKEIMKIEEIKKYLLEKNKEYNSNIEKLEDNIHNQTKNINEYIKNLNIPATPPELWIKKSDEIAKLHKKAETATTEKELYKIRKKIKKIDKEMTEIWDGKKVEQLYEEILPIEDKIFFITTFIHANQSITEKIIDLQQFKNGKIEVVNQIKKYENINEYKKDVSLIEDISTNKNNIKFQFASIKEFLNQQEKQKNWKISKSEIFVFVLITIISITLLSLPITLPLVIPTLSTIAWEKALVAVVGLVIGQVANKWITNLVEDKTKKVQSRIKQKFHSLISKIPGLKNFGKTKEELDIKNNIKKTIENLSSDKLETKLQTQYEILKQELDNKKDMKPDQLISNNKSNHNSNSILENLSSDKLETKLQTQYEILKQELDNKKDMKPEQLISNNKSNHNSNSILENSSIKSENNQNFDSSIKNTVNYQESQPLTSSIKNWNKVKCLLTT